MNWSSWDFVKESRFGLEFVSGCFPLEQLGSDLPKYPIEPRNGTMVMNCNLAFWVNRHRISLATFKSSPRKNLIPASFSSLTHASFKPPASIYINSWS